MYFQNGLKILNYITITLGTYIVSMIFFNGWFFNLSYGAYDLLSGHSTYISQFVRSGGWENLVYSFLYLGGGEVLPLTGILPIQKILLLLIDNPVLVASFTMLFLVYLLTISMLELTKEASSFLYKVNYKHTNLKLILLVIAYSFLPVVAWRINHGHLNIINGLLASVMCFYIPLVVFNKSINFPRILLIILSLAHALSFSSQQMIVYSIFFSSPFWMTMLFLIIKNKQFKSLSLGLVSIVSSILCVLPTILLTLNYFVDQGSERGVGDLSIFSYITPSYNYLLSSLGLSVELIPSKIQTFLHHEINYPFGSILLLMTIYFLLVFKKNIKRTFLFVLPLLYTVAFSFDFFSITSILIKAISILGAFRVPSRSIIILILIMNVYVMVSLFILYKKDDFYKKEYLIPLLTIPILSTVKLTYLEPFLLVVAIVLLLLFHFKKIKNNIFVLVLISFIVGSNISAFKERFSNKVNVNDFHQVLKQMKLEQQGFDIGYKAISLLNYGYYSENFLTMNEISVINSYWHPPKSFNETYSKIFSLKSEKTRLSFRIPFENDGFKVFSTLYGINTIISVRQVSNGNQVNINKIEGTKNIWSPSRVKVFEKKDQLFKQLKMSAQVEPKSLYDELYVMKDKNIDMNLKSCDDYHIENFGVNRVIIKTVSKNNCVIVLPFNYSKYLIATDKNNNSFPLFNSYNSLIGINVKSGSNTIKIDAPHPFSHLFFIPRVMFLLLLLILIAYSVGILDNIQKKFFVKKA